MHRWDFVTYDFCQVEIEKDRPPIEDQVANIIPVVNELDTNNGTKNSFVKQLEDLARIEDPAEQGERLYQISRRLFQLRKSCTIRSDDGGSTSDFSTLLSFAKNTVSPDSNLEEGFKGNMKVYIVESTDSVIVPAQKDVHIRYAVEVDAPGNSNNIIF